MAPLATAGLPFHPGGGFDPSPAIGAILALLLARWGGIGMTRRSVPLLLVLGTATGYAAEAWGLVPAMAAGYALLAIAALAGALRGRGTGGPPP